MRRDIVPRHASFGLLLIFLWGHTAHAKTIDQRPCRTILLTRSAQFIAQDAWNSVALHGIHNAEAIRRFPASSRINTFDVTADEELLLVACDNGEIGVWNIGTGNKLWWHTSARSGLEYIYDASFSGGGASLVVCNQRDYALVFETKTGMQIGKVSFPTMQTNIMSATLSPDGSKGALVDLGERLFTFDARTGVMRDSGLKGAWPVRYSADGRHLALRSSNSGEQEQLRVVAADGLAMTDVGQFSHIGHIRPARGGGFLVCARVGRRFDEAGVFTVGVEYHPGPDKLQEVWKLPVADAENRTDFDPKQMIGVSTDYRLVTRLIDLRTGKPRLTIDNSANYRENVLTYTSLDFPGVQISPVWVVVGILAIALAGWVIANLLSRKKSKPLNP